MSDLVSRQAVIDLIEGIETERLKGNIELIYAPAIKGLRALPSAQLERNKGRWIEHEFAEIAEGYLISNYECSCCHTWERRNSDYCPECGADMRGEQDG